MPYQPPVDEHIFTLRKVIGIRELAGTARFADFDEEDAAEILAGAGRLAADILNPLQRSGDMHPARLSNGVVVAPPGYAEGLREIAEGGWIGICARPDHGGAGLPASLGNAVNEILNGSCMSLGLSPLLTQGQIRALEAHASGEIKRIYLPRLASGRWLGTMNITEPEAGSDVGALRCAAEADPDGSFRLTGQKIYISWADAEFAENVCHLVLARLPSSPAGTKGLSLFIVPKFIPDDLGRPGERNSVRVASLEHKLGLHGSPTAVVEHGRGQGLDGRRTQRRHAGDVHHDEPCQAGRRKPGRRGRGGRDATRGEFRRGTATGQAGPPPPAPVRSPATPMSGACWR